WERHRNKARDASPCTPVFLIGGDGLASQQRKQQPSEASPRRKQATTVLQTADTLAVDKLEAYEALPLSCGSWPSDCRVQKPRCGGQHDGEGPPPPSPNDKKSSCAPLDFCTPRLAGWRRG